MCQRFAGTVDDKFSMQRRFVGSADASELCQCASSGLLVQSLGIARLTGRQIGGNMDFMKRLTATGTGTSAIRTIGRNKGGDADQASIGKQRCHFTDTTDVFGPVLRTEPEVGIETAPHIVAIEHIAG